MVGAWKFPGKVGDGVGLRRGVGGGLQQCSEPRWGPGVVVPEIPIQEHTRRSGWDHGEFSITPLADFTIRARILGVKPYSGSSLESVLSPVDVALGWGNMSDEVVLDQLHITQSGRRYHYRWTQSPPLPVREIIRSSANMHLVPATPQAERALGRLRAGDVVVIDGALITDRAS